MNIALDEAHRKVLDSLLGTTANQDKIEFSEGPELRITSAAELRVEGMTVECNDPATAAKDGTAESSGYQATPCRTRQ